MKRRLDEIDLLRKTQAGPEMFKSWKKWNTVFVKNLTGISAFVNKLQGFKNSLHTIKNHNSFICFCS